MVRRFCHLAPVLPDFPVRPDPHGGADHARDNLAIHLFFTKGAILCHYLFIRIAQQGERNVEFGNKFLVGRLAVGRNPQYDCIKFLEFAIKVTESLGFLGSPGSIVFGIEVENDVFALEILQRHFFAVFVRQCECRCTFASL